MNKAPTPTQSTLVNLSAADNDNAVISVAQEQNLSVKRTKF